jgi:ABC-type polysaccharide/polyol phosphate export permease
VKLPHSFHAGLMLGVQDILGALQRLPLVLLLGYQDIRQRYQRSFLGPFWLTISMGIMIACIGIVFGSLFKSDLSEFLPFLAAGLILWTFILSSVTEGSTTFISETRTIQQIPLPLTVYILKMVWRNMIILGHNLLIIPVVMIIFGLPLTTAHLLFIPGVILLTLTLIWITFFMSVVCARFRDLSQIVASFMQVMFYISPILWSPALIQESSRAVIVDLNPIYYLLDITRAPILGQQPQMISWVVSLAMLVVGTLIVLPFFGRFKKRIPYWL